MKKLAILLTFLSASLNLSGQNRPLSDLTVEQIMQDPVRWIGVSPNNISWSRDGSRVFFDWNESPGGFATGYEVKAKNGKPEKSDDAGEGLPSNFVLSEDESTITYSSGGDIFLKNLSSEEETQLTFTSARESNPQFHSANELTYLKDGNLFLHNMQTGTVRQLTEFEIKSSERTSSNTVQNTGNRDQDRYLRSEQLATSSELRNRRGRRRGGSLRFRNLDFGASNGPSSIRVDQSPRNVRLSPDGKFVAYQLLIPGEKAAKPTMVPNYLATNGYTTPIETRAKVGGDVSYLRLGIYDIEKDSSYFVDTEALPGITDLPDYVSDYPDKTFEPKVRKVSVNQITWSKDGRYCALNIVSLDNKDRWIMQLNPESGELSLIERQRDEAWLDGPGIGSRRRAPSVFGFLPDNKTVYYQSEATGYSYLYTYDLSRQEKKQITQGNFEVYNPQLSDDGQTWYFTANAKHPGIRHFYHTPVGGGKMTQITSMDGRNDVTISPDEKYLAIRHSYSNQPWELYIQENKPGAKAHRVTESQTREFKQYEWIVPEMVTFEAEDGANVHARLYKPDQPNGAAVIFVHGAGYTQNVHYWWASYFREYMFNQLLMAKGYTVLDIDYRGSAGYGRDWRTGIYRHMGGKDLSDHIDGVKYLVDTHGVDTSRIGMYGGSYGGFITLFALFKHPDVIAAGAALRSVTDWAHYNHGYTSNILNTPVEDPIAFKRSSPIYFAEGFEGHLLIAHGMVDRNVHFQDVVRLSQRLIELGKDNWEMAIYPVEDHGFTTPSSWTDEYKRILKLFENTIGQN